MSDKNEIKFPKQPEQPKQPEKEELLPYVSYYIPFTAVKKDGSTLLCKDNVLVSAEQSNNMKAIELHLANELKKQGITDIKDIVIHNLLMSNVIQVPKKDVEKNEKEKAGEEK